MNFKDLGLSASVLEAISSMGYETPSAVQESAIPVILEGKDIIVSAQTGTGKTAAFLLPLIQKLEESDNRESIRALIIAPTRELAIQIDQQMEGFSYFSDVSSIAVYGGGDGAAYSNEKKVLQQGANIIICTPGKMISHLNMGYVDTTHIDYLILDEADRMLDIGFYDDIMRIISYLPKKRQNLMFSATMPAKIRTLAKSILNNPVAINLAISKPPEKIKQSAYVVYAHQKLPILSALLLEKQLRSIIIFCSTKVSTKQLKRELKQLKLAVEDIHSDLEQKVREETLRNFKNRKLSILVATDILSRGIDIEDIDMIINYDVPHDGEDYVHRIGRTARAEADGIAITFISEKEQGKFSKIEDLLGEEIRKEIVPESFGATPEYNPQKRISGTPGKKPFKRKWKKKTGSKPNNQTPPTAS